MGLKGCTVYRPNDITGSIIEAESTNSVEKEVENPTPTPIANIRQRPEVLTGQTIKVQWPLGETPATYITVNSDNNTPFEFFLSSMDAEEAQWRTAVSVLLTSIARSGGDLEYALAKLQKITDPRGGCTIGGKWYRSPVGFVASRILEVMNNSPEQEDDLPQYFTEPSQTSGDYFIASKELMTHLICTSCGSPNITKQEGCIVCLSCGHSRC